MTEPIDAVVLNAGGMGGKAPMVKTDDGVTQLVAVNLLGHVLFVDELLAAKKIGEVVTYAGSEAARGVKKMGMPRPKLASSSVDEFASICDGSFFEPKADEMAVYGYVKYVAALWMSSLARQHQGIRFVTVSPGFTGGTNVMDDLPPFKRFMFQYIAGPISSLFGLKHDVDKGAQRYVDVVLDEAYESGVFYASKASSLTGPLVDQATIFEDVANAAFQDNANEAIHRFLQ